MRSVWSPTAVGWQPSPQTRPRKSEGSRSRASTSDRMVAGCATSPSCWQRDSSRSRSGPPTGSSMRQRRLRKQSAGVLAGRLHSGSRPSDVPAAHRRAVVVGTFVLADSALKRWPLAVPCRADDAGDRERLPATRADRVQAATRALYQRPQRGRPCSNAATFLDPPFFLPSATGFSPTVTPPPISGDFARRRSIDGDPAVEPVHRVGECGVSRLRSGEVPKQIAVALPHPGLESIALPGGGLDVPRLPCGQLLFTKQNAISGLLPGVDVGCLCGRRGLELLATLAYVVGAPFGDDLLAHRGAAHDPLDLETEGARRLNDHVTFTRELRRLAAARRPNGGREVHVLHGRKCRPCEYFGRGWGGCRRNGGPCRRCCGAGVRLPASKRKQEAGSDRQQAN